MTRIHNHERNTALIQQVIDCPILLCQGFEEFQPIRTEMNGARYAITPTDNRPPNPDE